jgi:polyisoprenoid-binding protein YceI
MRHLLLALALVGIAVTAAAQTKPAATPAPGSASVKTQLQALHYGNVRDLRRGPDGQWTGKATQNGVEKQVTINPKGVVTAR